jgi:hypothetical protein
MILGYVNSGSGRKWLNGFLGASSLVLAALAVVLLVIVAATDAADRPSRDLQIATAAAVAGALAWFVAVRLARAPRPNWATRGLRAVVATLIASALGFWTAITLIAALGLHVDPRDRGPIVLGALATLVLIGLSRGAIRARVAALTARAAQISVPKLAWFSLKLAASALVAAAIALWTAIAVLFGLAIELPTMLLLSGAAVAGAGLVSAAYLVAVTGASRPAGGLRARRVFAVLLPALVVAAVFVAAAFVVAQALDGLQGSETDINALGITMAFVGGLGLLAIAAAVAWSRTGTTAESVARIDVQDAAALARRAARLAGEGRQDALAAGAAGDGTQPAKLAAAAQKVATGTRLASRSSAQIASTLMSVWNDPARSDGIRGVLLGAQAAWTAASEVETAASDLTPDSNDDVMRAVLEKINAAVDRAGAAARDAERQADLALALAEGIPPAAVPETA